MEEEVKDVREQIDEYMKSLKIPQSLIYKHDTVQFSQSHIRQVLSVRSRPLTESLRKQINSILGTSFGDKNEI